MFRALARSALPMLILLPAVACAPQSGGGGGSTAAQQPSRSTAPAAATGGCAPGAAGCAPSSLQRATAPAAVDPLDTGAARDTGGGGY